jgi:hypothetical protein
MIWAAKVAFDELCFKAGKDAPTPIAGCRCRCDEKKMVKKGWSTEGLLKATKSSGKEIM